MEVFREVSEFNEVSELECRGEGTLGRGFPLPEFELSPPRRDVAEALSNGELIGKLIVESFLPTAGLARSPPPGLIMDLILIKDGLPLKGDLGGMAGGVSEVGELGIE